MRNIHVHGHLVVEFGPLHDLLPPPTQDSTVSWNRLIKAQDHRHVHPFLTPAPTSARRVSIRCSLRSPVKYTGLVFLRVGFSVAVGGGIGVHVDRAKAGHQPREGASAPGLSKGKSISVRATELK